MDKKQLLRMVLEKLKTQHQLLFESAKEAKDAATNEESKAENKYDTRGLEASYLAGAQAQRTTDLEVTIKTISDLQKAEILTSKTVISTSLIHTEVDGDLKQRYFILPKVGGLSLEIDQNKVLTLNPESPLGEHFMGLKVGDHFELQMKNQTKEFEILEIL
jgi:transcription elongation GreA/GreB family factor